MEATYRCGAESSFTAFLDELGGFSLKGLTTEGTEDHGDCLMENVISFSGEAWLSFLLWLC